jgi:hypothetical protein
MADTFDETSHRVIAFRKGGSELVLDGNGTAFFLPRIGVPPFCRVAESLTGAIKQSWGSDAVCLFSFQSSGEAAFGASVQFHVIEIVGDADVPAQMRWIAVADLRDEHFHSSEDNGAIEQALRTCFSETGGSFARFGWLADLKTWVEQVIRPLGLTLTGKFRQLNGTATFSLIRFETNGPAVWFKAVGHPNLREFSTTIALANVFPTAVPRLIGVREESNAWLSLEAPGVSLADFKSIAEWESSAAAFARLQTTATHLSCDLLQAGARNLTASAFGDLVEPVFGRIASAMEQQSKPTPEPLRPSELDTLKTEVQEALYLVSRLGIPDSLGHFDLNPANIRISQDACIFLDWAEAYVGNPFLSLHPFLEHCRRSFPWNVDLEERITSAYAEPWSVLISSHAANEGMRLCSLLAVFAYAAAGTTSMDEEALLQPRRAGYLRALGRRMKREADLLRSQHIYA